MNSLINDEKHYLTLNNYLKNKYHQKCFRIALDAGFTCPNRDGTKSTIGCTFCSSNRSGDFTKSADLPFSEQFRLEYEIMTNKWQNGAIIAYLQAGTNTYAPIDILKAKLNELLTLDGPIIAYSIGTRPDALSDEVIELLNDFNKKKELWVELGLQTMHDEIREQFNCLYTLNDFITSVKKLKEKNIKVIAHIINGLPNETEKMMIETVKLLNLLHVDGVKIHMLHIMKNTPLADIYSQDPFPLLDVFEYARIVSNQLRYLKDDIVIHRVTGDSPKDLLIAPLWTLKKFVVINEIDKWMRKNNIYQGDLLNADHHDDSST